jgi:hypothetical protein
MSFWSDFTGASARKDIRNANKQATAAIDDGLQQGVTDYTRARETLDPYAEGGGKAFNAMMSAHGLNGRDAQEEYFTNYMSSPAIESAMRAVNRNMAAKGLSNSGASHLAAARVWTDDYNNQTNRMLQLGQQGQQAATGQATIDTGIGDMRFGTGQLKANNAINTGNAMANTRSIGVNNLLSLGGLAVSAATGGAGGTLNNMMRVGGNLMKGAPAGYGNSWASWTKPA